MKIKKRIRVSGTVVQKIANDFGVTKKCVWESLRFKGKSELQRKIRYVALKEYSGVILEDIIE